MRINKITALLATALCLFQVTELSAKTTIEVASWKGAGAEVANFPLLIEKFEKEYPDIEVKLNYMSRGDVVTNIPARFQAGDSPDVVMVDREFVIHWGKNNLLRSLEDIPSINNISDEFTPALGLDGKPYYTMLQVSGMGMYVNQTMLKDAGIKAYPKNTKQFLDVCETLVEQGMMPMILPANNGNWTPFIFLLSMGLADQASPTQDRIEQFNSGKIKFAEDKAMLAAFETLREMENKKCFDPRLSAGTDPWSVGLSSFQSGRVAMLPQGMWNIHRFEEDSLPSDFTFEPFPSFYGSNGMAMDYYGPGWAIPVMSKNIEEAKLWIDFWLQDENLKLFVEADVAMSTLKNGTHGLPPAIASQYLNAKDNGGYITFPVGSLPSELTKDMGNDITAFMLDTSLDYVEILKKWDKTREKYAQ